MNANNQRKNNEAKEKKWTVYDSKVNLAALLNDPRKVRRDYDLFTKTWGETFRDLPQGSTLRRSKWIPNVQRGHFSDYLSSTGDQLIRHESQSLKNLCKGETDGSDVTEGSSFTTNNTSIIKSAVTAQQERDAIIKTRKALDALPKLFLRTDFNMGNPQIFASVLSVHGNNDDSRPEDPVTRRDKCSSRMLQDKLSHYLDRVEMAIVRQISLQSDSFFKAMESQEELHEYLNRTMSSVQNLISKVKLVKQNVVDNSFQVIQLQRSHINSRNLLAKLHMMITVHQTQPTIQLLLSTSEYAGSLDLIRTTQEVLHQELAGLHCFRHLSSQLTEMERVIGQMMRQEMDECLRDEIHRSVTEGHACRDPHRLNAVTLGLIRQGQFEFLQEFREEIEVAVRTIIKDTVLDAVEEPDGEKNETLASRMRMLEFTEWIQLLNSLFNNLLVLLRRIKILLDILSAVAKDSVARGDVCRVSRFKRFTNESYNRKTRLKSHSNKNFAKSRTKEVEKASNESSNPFLESASNSDSNGETPTANPFGPESPKKLHNSNPFESPNSSPKKSVEMNGDADANNPFLEEFSDQNDLGEALMDGLASYEDELINTAADSFVNPPDTASSSKDKMPPQPSVVSTPGIMTSEQIEETVVEEAVLTSEECNNFLANLNDLLLWSLNFEQDRCVKVLIAKGKDQSLDKLSSGDFLKLAKSIERFTSEAEDVVMAPDNSEKSSDKQSHGMKSSLRGALQTQAGKFVARFHDERRNKLSLILDNEVWKQAEVPAELSNLLQNLVQGRMSSNSNSRIENSKTSALTNGHDHQQKVLEYLVLDGERYAVVGTVLILLKMVTEYCKCSDDLPASTADLVHRLRDLLTLFNSRTCQLILGAGALQLVGLKTITTKNLALASRCLQLVLRCLPSIKQHFENKLMQCSQSADEKPQKNRGVLRHFDHVTKDYQDHVHEVENKLTVIVLGVIERHLSNWEVKAPVPSPSFRSICKQVTKFYDTVSSLLPLRQICKILMLLTDELKGKVRALLHKCNVRNDGGPQHGLVTSDLSYYETNIKNLKGMELVDLKMYSVWS